MTTPRLPAEARLENTIDGIRVDSRDVIDRLNKLDPPGDFVSVTVLITSDGQLCIAACYTTKEEDETEEETLADTHEVIMHVLSAALDAEMFQQPTGETTREAT